LQRKTTGRELAVRALHLSETKEIYIDRAFSEVEKEYDLNKVERSLAMELAYGVSRRRNSLDWAINLHAKTRVEKTTPWIRAILRISAYQLLYLDRIPARAICHEGTNLAKRFGHQGVSRFVNAVCRNLSRNLELPWPEDPVENLALRYCHPEWLVRRWLGQYGFEETKALMEHNNRTPVTTLRVNTSKISKEELKTMLTNVEEGLYLKDSLRITGYDRIESLPGYKEGFFWVQDESSQVPVEVLGVGSNETIIDACSAPGSKTMQIAAKSNNNRIIATDVSDKRLMRVSENANRLGFAIDVLSLDAKDLGKRFPLEADRVLVDAPCSGLGVLAKRPDARWQKSEENIKELVSIQREILESAWLALKPGGILVYSTCTLAPEENEEQIKAFLADHEDAVLDDMPSLPEVLRDRLVGGMLHILPQDLGIDGFFVARMVKRK